ncbi:protein kinase domain-containing protein [Streptomyces sp. HNM1019]|uniref:serine/threonine-protein kinase n=1 Tax=Streptomyces sp. HNM1019 TaxID=3424717 RepID=UPI003D773AAE
MEDLGAEDPRWIGEYRLLRRLGAGGMGRVFLAHSSRGRTVAVKLVQTELAQQAEFRRRFKQEVRAAQRVGGTWTAPVLDADTEAATPWVATGYIAGPSLHAVVAESGRLPERTVRILAHGLTQALRDIHDAGLVHRDLKPSNILVTIDGPRVIDFGIARALETVTDGLLTRSGAVVGSPGFMSPEQVRGERVSPASDVFSLGSVLAYAATGRRPFGTADSGVHAVMYRIAQEEPDLEGLPEGLLDLVTDCLKKAPDDRPSLEALLERTAGADDDTEPWLPGALVAQLGRHAVRLLEVETPAGPGVPARPAVPPVAGVAGPAVPPPPSAPPSATSYPLAPAEPPTPPPPTTPPRPSAAPLPPAPSTPPSTGAAQDDPAQSQPGGDQGNADVAAGPQPGTPSADPRRSAEPSAEPSGAPQAAAPSEAADGSPATPNASGAAAPGHDAPHATPSGPPATPHAGAGPQAGAPQTPGGATPAAPHAATPAAPHAATPAAPHAATPDHGTPGHGAPPQAGAGAAAANPPGSGGPYAPGAYGYPSHATPPQAPQARAEGEPPAPAQGFGPPAVSSFGAATGSPSAGFGGPGGTGTPGGPGGGPSQPPPGPNRRRKTLIVVSAAVATALIAGVAALAIVKGNDDKGDRAKNDHDKMTHTPPNPGGSGGSGGSGGGNSKGPSGSSDGPEPSATNPENSGDVPTEYLGAWEGEIKEGGESTGKIRRVVLSQGPVGAAVAETLTSDSDSFCQDSAKLKSADSLLLIEDEDVATSVPEDSCSAVGEQTLRIGNDGTLAWSTTDGSSEAMLRPSKSGGEPIPSGYVGTWLAKDAFGKPDATLKITVKQGAIGSVVAQEVADSKKYHCEGDRILASVEKGLVLSPSKFTGGTPKNLCGPGTSLTFTSSGHDKLRVEYDDPDDFSDETMTQTFTRLD